MNAAVAMTRRALCLLALLCAASVSAAPFHAACVDATPGELRDGYCLHDLWIPGLITHATYYAPPPRNFTTRWLYQADGLAEATARMKGFDGSEDYIALLSPSTAGWKAYLWSPDEALWIPVRVVDVAAREHMYFHAVPLHSGGELSGALADRLRVKQWVNVDGTRYRWLTLCIVNERPEDACLTHPALDYEDWFRSIVSWVGS